MASPCCPPNLGCNARGRAEPCVLELCDRLDEQIEQAAVALARWKDWQAALELPARRRELRFRRRAYERARDRAMGSLALAGQRRPEGLRGPAQHVRPAPSRALTRLELLLTDHGQRRTPRELLTRGRATAGGGLG